MLLKTHSEKVRLLQEVPLFAGLGRRHLDLVARDADQVTAEAGQPLTRQGGLGHEFLLIVEGRARVERDGTVLARLGAGDCLGEMSVIDGRPRSATVIAEGPMSLLAIHTRSFGELLDTVPAFRRRILTTLCDRLRQADEVLASTN